VYLNLVHEKRVCLGKPVVHLTSDQVARIIIHVSNMCPSKTSFLEGIKDEKTAENSREVALRRASTLQKELLAALASDGSVRFLDLQLESPLFARFLPETLVINPSVLLQDLRQALVRRLISLLACAVLCVITFTTSLIWSPVCANWSPS